MVTRHDRANHGPGRWSTEPIASGRVVGGAQRPAAQRVAQEGELADVEDLERGEEADAGRRRSAAAVAARIARAGVL